MKTLQGMTSIQILTMASYVTTNKQGGAMQWRVMLKTAAYLSEPAVASACINALEAFKGKNSGAARDL
eukprot:14364623-Heterocapsa_arctica.AAC.1